MHVHNPFLLQPYAASETMQWANVVSCYCLSDDVVSFRKKWWASLSHSCLFFSLPSYLCSLLCKGSCGCQVDKVIKVDEDSQVFSPHCCNWKLLWKINLIISALNFIYDQFILLNCCASIVLEWLPSLLSIYAFDVLKIAIISPLSLCLCQAIQGKESQLLLVK